MGNMVAYDLNKVEKLSAFIANIDIWCFPGYVPKTCDFYGNVNQW